MKPLNKVLLYKNGDSNNRIGNNKRNPNINSSEYIEKIIDEECPLSVTCDVVCIHPPYFSEFNYMDNLGGITLKTLSAEINYRLTEIASKTTSSVEFPIDKVLDKYVLPISPKTYNKVVSLPGSNSLHLIDQSKLQSLMQDDEWVIKLHPVTGDDMIRALASIYGYHRLLDAKMSGVELLKGSKEVATLATSELFILARFLDKPVIDLTRFDKYWLAAYSSITRLLTNTSNDIQILNNIFMSEVSGHLRYEYNEVRNRELANNFYSLAMNEREKFKMISNQKLVVADKTFKDWF